MNSNDRYAILQLPFSEKELYAPSRNKNGYTTYLSWYVIQFNELGDKTKKSVCSNGVIVGREGMEGNADDNDSVQSEEKIAYYEIMKLAVAKWRKMTPELKNSWKERADLVNSLPLLGKFETIPEHINPIQDSVILETLNQEFTRFQGIIKKSLMRTYKNKKMTSIKTFGLEKVVILDQVFKTLFLSHLLKTTFFGPSLSFLRKYEVVMKTNKTAIIYINSRKRMIELFSKNELCPFEIIEGDILITVAAKIILSEINTGKEIYGYVNDEESYDMNIQCILADGTIFTCRRPEYDIDQGIWNYFNDDKYTIVQYNPIRIRIVASGSCQMTYNRFKLNNRRNNIICF